MLIEPSLLLFADDEMLTLPISMSSDSTTSSSALALTALQEAESHTKPSEKFKGLNVYEESLVAGFVTRVADADFVKVRRTWCVRCVLCVRCV